jgi:hypothetical protein
VCGLLADRASSISTSQISLQNSFINIVSNCQRWSIVDWVFLSGTNRNITPWFYWTHSTLVSFQSALVWRERPVLNIASNPLRVSGLISELILMVIKISNIRFWYITVLIKIKFQIIMYHHGSQNFENSNDYCLQIARYLAVLSRNLVVLWGVWNTRNQQFFDSGFFYTYPDSGASLIPTCFKYPQSVVLWFWFFFKYLELVNY